MDFVLERYIIMNNETNINIYIYIRRIYYNNLPIDLSGQLIPGMINLEVMLSTYHEINMKIQYHYYQCIIII